MSPNVTRRFQRVFRIWRQIISSLYPDIATLFEIQIYLIVASFLLDINDIIIFKIWTFGFRQIIASLSLDIENIVGKLKLSIVASFVPDIEGIFIFKIWTLILKILVLSRHRNHHYIQILSRHRRHHWHIRKIVKFTSNCWTLSQKFCTISWNFCNFYHCMFAIACLPSINEIFSKVFKMFVAFLECLGSKDD